MIAHHPETGQPIRILRSDAKISRDQRTLVWITADLEPSPRWSRWSTLVSDPTALPILAGHTPACVIVRDHVESWVPFLKEHRGALVLGTKTAVRDLTARGVDTSEVLFFHELFELYPYLGEPLHDEDPLEKAVISAAHILRHQRIAWRSTADLEAFTIKAQIHAWRTCLGPKNTDIVSIGTKAEEVIPQVWLIQQYFRHPTPRRAREIHRALEKNRANPYIDRILLLNEVEDAELGIPADDKIETRVIGHRLTYLDVLEAVNRDLPTGSIAVFSNSDIWFDDTLSVLWSLGMESRRLFLALLRWEDGGEDNEPTLFGPRADSQDAWIIAKKTVEGLQLSEDRFGFPFGKPGCDNAIALAMLQQKCLVVNPAYTLKSYHIHASNIRNYNPQDILYKPVYLYVDPTPIQSQTVDTTGSRQWISTAYKVLWEHTAPTESFSRRIQPIADDVGQIVVTALNRRYHGEQVWDLQGTNMWTPTQALTQQPLYEWKEPVFVTAEGLVSNFQTLFLGLHAEWRTGWESAQISTMTPAIHVPAMVSVGVGSTFAGTLADWVLQNLPTVLRMQACAGGSHEFLVPPLDSVGEFLQDCKWRSRHVGSVPVVENIQYYTNHLLATPPAPVSATWITREDVGALRELLPSSVSSPSSRPHMVLCLSDILHAGWAEEVQACHGGSLLKGWKVTVLEPHASHKARREAFQRADWIVGSAQALKWIWMARPGTCVLEFMEEGDIQATILHIAGAAECTYIPSLIRREPVEFQRQHALLDVGSAVNVTDSGNL